MKSLNTYNAKQERNVPIDVTNYNIQTSAFFKSRNLNLKKKSFCDHFNIKPDNGSMHDEIIVLHAIINSMKHIQNSRLKSFNLNFNVEIFNVNCILNI